MKIQGRGGKIKAMKITIEASGLELTPALKVYIEDKFKTLSKITEKLEGNANAEILVEVSRATKHHHKGDVFHAEGNLKLGKTLLRAEADGESMRAAIDVLKDEFKREVTSFKDRFVSSKRRGVRSDKSPRLSK